MRTSYKNRTLKDSFGDSRLEKRFETITEQLSQNLSGSISESALKFSRYKSNLSFFSQSTSHSRKDVKLL